MPIAVNITNANNITNVSKMIKILLKGNINNIYCFYNRFKMSYFISTNLDIEVYILYFFIIKFFKTYY